MAISAILQFGDNDCKRYSREYPVLGYECHFQRQYRTAVPDSSPSCSNISITVVHPGKENLELIHWFADQTCMSGRILLDTSDMLDSAGGTDKRCIKFEDARCYAIEEDYSNSVNRLRLLKLDIMAEEMEIDSVRFNL